MSSEMVLVGVQGLAVTGGVGDLVGLLLERLSASSQRQYRHTFTDWGRWCAEAGIHSTELTARTVMAYLKACPISPSTAQARLSHLRALAQTLHTADTADPVWQQRYTELKWLKLGLDWQGAELPEQPAKGRKRPGQALDPARVHELLAAYPTHTLRGLCNRALLAVLFYAGLRRFEAAKLEWGHIDWERQTLAVRRGGKGRRRETVDYVPFLGGIARYLSDWQAVLEPGRVYVFPRILKGDHLGADQPITPDGLYRQFAGDFAPHDARRTLITSLLERGAYIGDVKVVSRHAQESTLLKYAKSHSAQVVGARVSDKLGY